MVVTKLLKRYHRYQKAEWTVRSNVLLNKFCSLGIPILHPLFILSLLQTLFLLPPLGISSMSLLCFPSRDGRLVMAISCTDETLISGESYPRNKAILQVLVGQTLEGLLLLHSLSFFWQPRHHFFIPSWD